MKLPQVVARATSRLLVLLALVAVPSGIYLFAVVTKQENFHTARNLRAVSEVGAQLEDRFDALVQIALQLPEIPCEPGEKGCAMSPEQQEKMRPPESIEWYEKFRACKEAQEEVCNISPEQRAKIAQLESSEWFRKLRGRIETDPAVCRPPVEGQPFTSRTERVYRSVVSIDDDRDASVVVARCEIEQPALVLEVPLRDLIDSRRLEAGLDTVIVADCEGDVLYSDATRQIAVVDIANLVIGTGETGKTGGQANGSETEKDEDQAKESDTSAGSDSRGGRTQAPCAGRGESWVTAMEISGVPMRVYAHPYRPSNVVAIDSAVVGPATEPARANGHATTWYLLGLQSDAVFKEETRVLPFELIIVIAPLIVLAVLAWPLLVIALSGSGVRFGVGAPLSFIFAAVGGAGLLTIITLGLKYHFDVGVLQDELLSRVGSKLAAKFTAEMKQSIDLFDDSQDAGLPRPLPGESHSIADAVDTCEPERDETCFLFKSVDGEELLQAAAVFETAFELNGFAAAVGSHLSLRETPTSRNALPGRAYFQRASKGPLFELWPLTGDAVEDDLDKPDLRFAFEQIRSKDFGWLLSSISRPASLGSAPCSAHPTEPCVTVIIKRMQTFFAPILPVGVGFAVVRDSEGSATLDGTAWRIGDVLFHSDEARSLVENLLNETADDEGLAIAFSERRSSFLNVDYRGVPHRFYATPLPVPSWTLVVTAEKNLLRMYTWRNVLTAAAAFGSYLLFLAAVVAIVWLVERVTLRRSLPSWILPDADGALQGGASVALFGIAALLLSGTSAWIGPGAGAFTLWAIALGSACCTVGLLAVHFSKPPSSQTGSVAILQIGNAWRSWAGTVIFLIGSLLVASTVFGGAGDSVRRWSAVLLAAFVALFFAPTPRSQRTGLDTSAHVKEAKAREDTQTDDVRDAKAHEGTQTVATPDLQRTSKDATVRSNGSDARYVLLLISVLLAISATPAVMLIRDARSFHQEAYEKHNLGHIASAALRRETALLNEARRLQPTRFNRASLADVKVPDVVWCRGFFGLGAQPLVPACPSTPSVGNPSERSAESESAHEKEHETKRRTATSWFSVAMPVADGVSALVFSDGWRMSRSDGSIKWTDLAAGEVNPGMRPRWRVAAHRTMRPPYEFVSAEDGLFDRANSGDEPEPMFFGVLVFGSLALLALTWRALATVAATFFGSYGLRRHASAPNPGRPDDWRRCSKEEKLLLRHLADHIVVNRLRNERVIRNLWAKGLVTFDRELAGLRIVDKALESEIRLADHSKTEVEFELASRGGTWSEFRLPFFTALGVAVIVIIVAAPNTLSSVMAVLAASAGGIIAIIQIMSALMRKKD